MFSNITTVYPKLQKYATDKEFSRNVWVSRCSLVVTTSDDNTSDEGGFKQCADKASEVISLAFSGRMCKSTNLILYSWEVSVNNKEFLCITHTVEHNYISPSSTVGIQLHVSALYVGHLQVVI